jgi:hypothetical protein
MEGQFSTSHQPAGKRKAKAAHKGAHKKHIQTASLAELLVVRAVKKSILRGKLSNDNGKSDMEENMNVDKEVNRNEDYIEQEDYTQMTMEERKAMGLLVVTQEEAHIAVKVSYVMEYGEPDESDWSPIITELSTRF